ncbi:MAG TPA: HupE/UreJ family protein [Gemmatimonadales bacterium]|nr:HupE/UreJ family protein [Gemmatimonadales bacterium]
MSEFLSFVHLGFNHIVNPEALDHILFLLALAAIYQGRDWRDSLWVISAFTVGHSITLALAATGTLLIPQRITEFLIPLTIVATGVENIMVRARARAATQSRYRPVFAGVFGLVHGAGFASYLQQLFIGSVVVPLFGFNVGIELGQLVVLAAAGAALAALDRLLLLSQVNRVRSYRLRVVTVSLVVVAVAAEMAAARRPW